MEIGAVELDVLREVGNVRVMIDVGARMAHDVSRVPSVVDYLKIYPHATYHLFEPNPRFAQTLRENIGDRKRVVLNQYGLGDEDAMMHYDSNLETFSGSEAQPDKGHHGDMILQIRTLDWYVRSKNIKKVDFIKIDVEGMDYQVIVGGKETIKKTRFIQYEHWDDKERFHKLLDKDFTLEPIGYRNMLCMNKRLVPAEERKRLRRYIRKNNYGWLS